MTDLVVIPAVATIRRRLGPVAWVVLEELLLGAGPADGTAGTTRSCDVTVRDLAERLGLDKDTVARAVRRLVDDRLIAREQARAVDGTFTRTTYRVEVPDGLRIVLTGPTAPAPPPPPRRTTTPTTATTRATTTPTTATTRATTTPAHLQLSLLDG